MPEFKSNLIYQGNLDDLEDIYNFKKVINTYQKTLDKEFTFTPTKIVVNGLNRQILKIRGGIYPYNLEITKDDIPDLVKDKKVFEILK